MNEEFIEDDETCAYCAGYKTEIARLKVVLNDSVILPLREALANARGGRKAAINDETH